MRPDYSLRPGKEAQMVQIASTRRHSSFTLIELIVIVGTLALLVFFLIPQAVRHRRRAACMNNLRQIGLAFKTWPITSDDFPALTPVEWGGTKELADSGQVFIHFRVMSNELSWPRVLVCPADRTKSSAKTFHRAFTDANVSYFVGLDATDVQPQVLLSGDRNLAVGRPLPPGVFRLTTNTLLEWTRAVHGSCGNLALADGSVRFYDSSNLTLAVRNQGIPTNRLAIP